MNKYESYKEVELSWLKEIPSHWECRRGKYIYEIKTGKLDVNAGSENGQYPFFTCSSLPKKINHYSFDCEALLVAGNGMVGYTQYYKGKFNAYQRTYVLNNFKNINPIYAKWYFKGILVKYLEKRYVGSVINFIVLNDLKSFEVLLPPIEEQKQIANYLDWKIDEIDRLILTEKEKLKELEKLEQKLKESYIFNGIDSTVDFKAVDSDYTPCIPEKWGFCKIKRLFKIKKRIAGELGFNVLSITQQGIKIKDISKNEGQMANDYSKYQIVDIGDFAMNHMDLLTGYIDISNYNGVTSPDYRVFTSISNKVYPKYYLYMFQIFYKNRVFYKYGQGASNLGRWRLPAEQFLNLQIPVPRVFEQKRIVEEIEKSILKFEEKYKKIKDRIELLQELKQSLISEVVTGQIDVRNIVIPEYEKVNVVEDTKEMESEEDGS